MALKSQYPKLQDAEWLRGRYLAENQTMYDIAAELGCSDSLVYLAMKKHGIAARPNSERQHPLKEKTCERCGSSYKPSGPAQRFCTPSCGRKSHACDYCGERYEPQRKAWRYNKRRFCSSDHREAFRMDANRRGTGRSSTSGGYILVKVPAGTPGVYSTGFMLEHRYVMQQAIGRPLESTETIHHVNGNKQDNRIENLQLRSGRHGKGVYRVCAACGSADIEERPL